MSGWRDISTAPKDGTVVEIGWLTEDHLEYSVEASWRFIQWRDPLGDDRALFINPTHWRPINARASGWQPIETAPKDGALFLAYWRGERIIAKWADVLVAGNLKLVGCNVKEPDGGQTVSELERKLGEHVLVEGPTHWQPLPPLPEAT